MAKKNGPGLSAPAPKPRATHAEKKAQAKKAAKAPSYAGLNKDQSQVINNVNQSDIGLSGYNNSQLPGVFNSYSQPFDESQLPQSPWAQGQTLKDMEGEYYNRAVENYNRSMADQNKQEDSELDKWAYETGNYVGSPAYKTRKDQLDKSRASAKQNAMDSAYFNAGQNASNWNNIGTQNFQNAYGYQMDMRNLPASEYAKIQGLMSGMPGQNLGASQALGLQQNDQAFQKYIFDHTPKGGAGGGGGGGAAPPSWVQKGFPTYQDQLAFETQRARDQQSWEWANNPQYRQQKQPSPWASGLGTIAGIGFGTWAGNGFSV